MRLGLTITAHTGNHAAMHTPISRHMPDYRGIVGDGFAAVGCQQVTPLRIAIDIIDSTYNCAQRAGGIGIGLFAGNITGVVICPHPSPARGLVVFTDQLVGTVSNLALWLRG